MSEYRDELQTLREWLGCPCDEHRRTVSRSARPMEIDEATTVAEQRHAALTSLVRIALGVALRIDDSDDAGEIRTVEYEGIAESGQRLRLVLRKTASYQAAQTSELVVTAACEFARDFGQLPDDSVMSMIRDQVVPWLLD